MEIYKENKILGNDTLPIELCVVTTDRSFGKNADIYPGFGNEIINEKRNYIFMYPQWHSYVEIIYFEEGTAKMQLNDNYFNVRARDIVLVDSFDIHSFEGEAKHYALLLDLTRISHFKNINERIIPELWENKWINRTNTDERICNNIIKSIKIIYNQYRKKETAYHFTILACLYEIIANVCKHTGLKESNNLTNNVQSKKLDIEKLDLIVKYINDNYKQVITLEEVAELVNISPNYFCRFFKRNMGRTFFEHLNYYRCSKAEILLNTTNKTITEIAFEVGFSSISYFDKVYKKIKGYRPSEKRI